MDLTEEELKQTMLVLHEEVKKVHVDLCSIPDNEKADFFMHRVGHIHDTFHQVPLVQRIVEPLTTMCKDKINSTSLGIDAAESCKRRFNSWATKYYNISMANYPKKGEILCKEPALGQIVKAIENNEYTIVYMDRHRTSKASYIRMDDNKFEADYVLQFMKQIHKANMLSGNNVRNIKLKAGINNQGFTDLNMYKTVDKKVYLAQRENVMLEKQLNKTFEQEFTSMYKEEYKKFLCHYASYKGPKEVPILWDDTTPTKYVIDTPYHIFIVQPDSSHKGMQIATTFPVQAADYFKFINPHHKIFAIEKDDEFRAAETNFINQVFTSAEAVKIYDSKYLFAFWLVLNAYLEILASERELFNKSARNYVRQVSSFYVVGVDLSFDDWRSFYDSEASISNVLKKVGSFKNHIYYLRYPTEDNLTANIQLDQWLNNDFKTATFFKDKQSAEKARQQFIQLSHGQILDDQVYIKKLKSS